MGTYTAQNTLYKPATSESGWSDAVDANWDALDKPELLNIAASAYHLAATLGAILDDLSRRCYLLETTRPFDMVIGSDPVLIGTSRVIVRL